MVFGGKFGDSPEKNTSANTSGGMSLINELYKFNRIYGSGGSSEVKFSAGTEDVLDDNPDDQNSLVDAAMEIAQKLGSDKEKAVDNLSLIHI